MPNLPGMLLPGLEIGYSEGSRFGGYSIGFREVKGLGTDRIRATYYPVRSKRSSGLREVKEA